MDPTPRPDDPAAARRREWMARLATWVLLPAALAGVLLVQSYLVRASTSATYDEDNYVRLGMEIYRHGDFRTLDEWIVAPLPLLLEYWLPAISSATRQGTPGWNGEEPGLIRLARLETAVVVGVPLVLAVYAWLAARRGRAAGALGGGMMALSPSIVAHASIATTDACFALFTVLALATFRRYERRPSAGSLAMAGVGLGLAISAKHTGVFLVPVALLMLGRHAAREAIAAGSRPKTRVDIALATLGGTIRRLAALGAVAFAVNWAAYGFGTGPPFRGGSTHMWPPVLFSWFAAMGPRGEAIEAYLFGLGPPLPIDTFLGQWGHAEKGHSAFLMGARSQFGWWYYFPVALALKSTPGELALAAAVGALACMRRGWSDPSRRLWLVSLGVFAAFLLHSTLNAGQRYALAVYPLVILIAVDGLAGWGRRRPGWAAAIGAALLAGQAVAAAGIAPDDLAYFNGICGGPAEGHRYLVDSNVDWGQELPALRRSMGECGYRKAAFAYFGTALPGTYGVSSTPWDAPDLRGCDCVAISATMLHGLYVGPDVFAAFRELQSRRAGYGLFLYDLADPRVRAALVAARHAWTGLPGDWERPGAPGQRR